MQIPEGQLGLFGMQANGVMYTLWAASEHEAERLLTTRCGGPHELVFFNTRCEAVVGMSGDAEPLQVMRLNEAPLLEFRYTSGRA